MVATLFSDLLVKGVRSGQIPNRTKSARTWFRDEAKKLGKQSAVKILKDSKGQFRNAVFPGRLYMFAYDAKLKDTLPFWDRFPMIVVVGPSDKVPGAFLGLNFHYLPYALRAKLMDALYTITNNQRFNRTTKIQMSYDVIKSASKFKAFKPALKMYLKSQVRSRFVTIDPADWDTALFLQTQSWQGASQGAVWADSRRQISGRRPRKKR